MLSMNEQDIINRIMEVLESMGGLKTDTITEETELNELIADSSVFRSFIEKLESVFALEIPYTLIQKEMISSLQELADVILELKEMSEEKEDLEDEIKSINITISELYDRLQCTASKEERDDILVEIANEKTIIRDIECMIADMKLKYL